MRALITAATSSQLLWYTTRTTGIVALVLLTASVVLGILTSVRFGTEQWPRFAVQSVHRRVSLLAVVFVALHVVTTVSDSYAPIGWLSVVVPFTSAYRRLWLGLGTAALDLLLAVTVSSLIRQKISPRSWRALHWLAYASWPLAVVHSLGTGTDPRLDWVILLVVACVASVLAALAWRLVAGWPAHAGTRVVAGVTSAVVVIGATAWTATGPLRPGWAARAGTPPALLGRASGGSPERTTAGSAGTSSPSTSTTTATTGSLPAQPFQAALAGTISQQGRADGTVQVTIAGSTSSSFAASLKVVIVGASDGNGGVLMQQSQAVFGPPGAPQQYRGHVARLDGTRLVLAMADVAGRPLDLRIDLAISRSGVSGELASVSPASVGAPAGGDDR